MKLELVKDGYAKLDSDMRNIEYMAMDGISTDQNIKDMVIRFRQIALAARTLQQTLQDVTLIVPVDHKDAVTKLRLLLKEALIRITVLEQNSNEVPA